MYKITEKKLLAPNIYLMKVYAPWVAKAAKPGQFLIVVLNKKSERIPLTICDYNCETGIVTIVLQVIGKSTQEMAKLETGDSFCDIVGPLGKEAEFVHENIETLKKKNFLFVAGGLGAAPVYPQLKWLKEHGVKADVIVGTRSKDMLFMEKELRAVSENYYVTTEDGSFGDKGLVTDKIKSLIETDGKKYDEVVAIGPMIMMKFVAALTKEYKIKTIVSLNTLMVDGTGMCGACRVTVGGQTRFACVDGPEFDAHLVDFDQALRRQQMYRAHEIGQDTSLHKCNLSTSVNESLKAQNPKQNALGRIKMREQDPMVRNKNFDEVSFGYNEEEAIAEASRCIQCAKPFCAAQCPVNIKIPQFIKAIREKNFKQAAAIIDEDSALPAICGRVCPQETQCEGSCILGKKGQPVAIGYLERFVADWANNNIAEPVNIPKSNGHKVAVVGSGPAGLTCASELAKMGYEVTIFEALHEPGGVLTYGIPEFRLPKEKVMKLEINKITKLGVKIETNVVIGKSTTVDGLLNKEGFKAVFISSGAGLPKFMDIPGENLNGVLSANEVLTRANLMKAYAHGYATPIFIGKKAAIVGGGNVAIDAARTAKRLGADVHIIYRRSENEMPARAEEICHAKEEGIHFHFLTHPTEILGDGNGWVKAVKCIKMQLGQPDETGRCAVSPIEGTEYEIEVSSVIISIGTQANPLIGNTTGGLDTTKRGNIVADLETGETSLKGVFAGGEIVTGAATVIYTMGIGKKVAKAIDRFIKENY